MSRVTLAPFVGPAAALYLIAAAASLPGAFDLGAWFTAGVALLLSLTPVVAQRHVDARGSLRVAWLGLCVSLSLTTTLSPQVGALWAIEGVRVLAFAGFAYLLIDLAMSVPEPVRTLVLRRPRMAIAACVSTGPLLWLVEALLPVHVAGVTWLVPTHFARAPEVVAAISVIAALMMRSLRARGGGRPELLAENAWAQLGLVPAAMVVVALGLGLRTGRLDWTHPWIHFATAGSALVLVRAHVLLIDARYRLAVGSAARRWIAVLLVTIVVCVLTIAVRPRLPVRPADLALWVVAAVLLATLGHRALARLLRLWLAPARGALLDAIEQATQRLVDVGSLSDVGAAVLPPLRHASLAADGLALLYAFDPSLEIGIDAAGQPRVHPGAPLQALADQVQAHPHEIIVRRALEDAVVRRSEVRPLVDALQRLDALCVIPLRNQSELEGMLVLPRGLRHASLSLEELSALDRFAALLSAFVAVISRESRAAQRLNEVIVARDALQQVVVDLQQDNARLHRHERALAQHALRADVLSPIAYSPKMRAACDRLRQLAAADVPVLLRAPQGVDLHPLLRMYHQQAERADSPLVVMDCASLPANEQRLALIGSDDPSAPRPGHLRLAQHGTLVVSELPALCDEAQTELLNVLLRKRMRPLGGAVDVPVDVRVVFTSRLDVEALIAQGRLDPKLAERLRPVTVAVPGLRERVEDLQSLVLLALDRAARVVGREPVGMEPDALHALMGHRFAGNDAELFALVERAVATCAGPRVTLSDLKLPRTTAGAPTHNPLSGTFDTVEKRVLKHALAEAQGNKSEAARLLGLKRTTFLDKLRRHGLDDQGSSSVSS